MRRRGRLSCTGNPSVCSIVCGDGVKAPSEACDDGNTVSGDCCSATCQLEAGCEAEPNNACGAQTPLPAFSGSPLETSIKGTVFPPPISTSTPSPSPAPACSPSASRPTSARPARAAPPRTTTPRWSFAAPPARPRSPATTTPSTSAPSSTRTSQARQGL
ncbi:MAG: DUF4215 domain-containing protein [Polyangiaceae bacterium]